MTIQNRMLFILLVGLGLLAMTLFLSRTASHETPPPQVTEPLEPAVN